MFTSVSEQGLDPYLAEPDAEPSADVLWQLTMEAAAEERSDVPVVLPPGLDSWLPSPYLAAVVSALSPRELSGHNRITLLKAQQRLVSHYQAKSYETMSSVYEVIFEVEDEIDEELPPMAFRMASAEIRAALHQTAKAANAELSIALDFTGPTYASVLHAFMKGLLDRRRAGLIVHRTSHLDPDTAQTVVTEVMKEAAELTSGEIIARIDELNITADPDEAKTRLEQGLEDRRVYAEKNWDGTGNYMGLHLSPERVAAAHRRINRLAKQLKSDTEPRTMDQLRADVYLDCSAAPSPTRGRERTGILRSSPRSGPRSTSESPLTPSPEPPKIPGRSPDGDRSSPTPPAGSSPNKKPTNGR